MSASSDDEAAFVDLYEQHRRGVHAFLVAKTSDPEAARDLLQETFLRLWRRLDEVVGLDQGRQRAWLFTVARNLVIDRYRSRATRDATVAALARQTRGAQACAPDAAQRVELRDQLAMLEQAIAVLPEEQRVILTMTAVAGMTSQQVGQALGLPPGTVRYRLHQARTRLARRLRG
jgi:RNA polymerase sigma-70 factor, ECF subfamily